jgi:GntR family transcriptional regulator, transcriptional repressor for pyruvate dehydrogenase complex
MLTASRWGSRANDPAPDGSGPRAAPGAGRVGVFEALSTSTLSQQVAASLVERILLERFLPGDPLPAAGELAREFGVSRPVVREALKEVVALGMVESRQGRYSRVTERSAWNDLSPAVMSARLAVGAVEDIIGDTLELRRVIETEAAALAAVRASEDDLERMRTEIAALDRSLEDDDAYIAHDLAFHDAVLRATNNRLFLLLLEQVRELLLLARSVSATSRTSRRGDSQAGHRALLAAIEARSPEDARRAMTDHLAWAERVNVSDYKAHLTGSRAPRPRARGAGRTGRTRN